MTVASQVAVVTFDHTAVQAMYAVATVTSVFLAYVVWRHRSKTGAKPLLAAIVGGWWWSTALLLATMTSDVGASKLLMRLDYVGIVFAVATIFLFALEYTGRGHLVNRRTIALLSIEPLIVIYFVLFSPEGFFFEAIEANPARAIGVEPAFGLGFHIHTLYSYGLVFVASALIVGLVYRTRALYRGQLAVLLGAVLLPLIPNFASILRLVDFDATPVGFLVADALYTVAITRYKLIDLAPIARDRVVNNVNDAVFVVDTEHRMVDMNPAAESLTEEFVGKADLIGENVREVLELVPDVAELYEDVVADHQERTIEYEIGGHHYLAEATPMTDTRDRHVGWLFIIRDITDQKRREQQLRERNEQLDKFASVVSHDLRNPLQVASGRVEIARETGDLDSLEAAETALDRMEAIIDDVLSLARSGEEVTDLAPVALRDAAESAWGNVETDGVALVVETEARVTADRDRLVRLLENLFRNAVEHGLAAVEEQPDETSGRARMRVREHGESDGGTGIVTEPSTMPPEQDDARLTVTVDLIRRNGRSIGFHVSDDGPGIPAEDRSAVFESGFSTSDEGTGFGLTIVSQIAAAHDWQVAAAESEDGGARFEFTGAEIVND